MESGHLEGDADLVAVMRVLLFLLVDILHCTDISMVEVLVKEQEERVRRGEPGHLPMRFFFRPKTQNKNSLTMRCLEDQN